MIKQVAINFFIIINAYITSYIMLKDTSTSTSFIHLSTLTVFIILSFYYRKIFWIFLFPLSIIYALYMPIGRIYGSFNYEYLIAVFSSDLRESTEFILQFEYRDLTRSLFILFDILLCFFIFQRYNIITKISKLCLKRIYLGIYTIFVIFLIIFHFPPFSLIQQIANATHQVYLEYNQLKNLTHKNLWTDVQLLDNTVNTHILIIGESARRDYHSLYGYPINNTPFMNNSNGIFIEGLTAGGKTTVPSLNVMLNLTDPTSWQPNHGYHIINLAKSAGIKTYWLSNQGYFGTHDTPISAIAKASDEVYFLKYGDYNSKNTKDTELLSHFANILKNNIEKKLIVLHLYGSHYNACDRLEGNDLIISIKNPKYQYINCYISSIKETDKLLEKVHNITNDFHLHNELSYSMLYFSDHGLVHQDFGKEIGFANYQYPSQYHYDVPLFKISSNDKEQIKCKSFKSPINFLNGLANWIGITAPELNTAYSLFDCNNDNEGNIWNHLERIINDPAEDLSYK